MFKVFAFKKEKSLLVIISNVKLLILFLAHVFVTVFSSQNWVLDTAKRRHLLSFELTATSFYFLQTIKSKDAWNAPENSTDFPYCVFEIAHLDETKQTFLCGIQASHLNDTAETELVAFFEQEQVV